MKKHDLQPTDDNIRNTFIRDSIGRNKDLVEFIKKIDSINESYSIALDSYWGSGKTFFVKQIKMILDTVTEESYGEVNGKEQILSTWRTLSNQIKLKKHVPIYYDAWANDCDDDPIYSLIRQLMIDSGKINGLTERINYNDLISVAGKITGFLAGKISDKLLGFNPDELLEALNKKSFLEELEQNKSIQKYIEEYINKLLPKGCDRLLIIIDELDRCNPEFAVKLLERIKHYFNNDKVTFLFSVNVAELQHTVKMHYGFDFNASRYLDRFFDLRVPLSKPKAELLLKNANYSIADTIDYEIAIAVYEYFNMQMRDYLKYISLLKRYVKPTFLANSIELINTYKIIENVLLPFVWGLMMNDANKFNNFMSGNDDSEFIEFLTTPKVFYTSEKYITPLFGDKINYSRIDRKITLDALTKYSVFHKLYDSFFLMGLEENIGNCKIRDHDKEFFHEAVSQMSKFIIIDEQE